MEKGNAIIRNLDLEAMVTPRFLYDKLLIEKKYLEMNQENMGKALTNTFDLRLKEVTENCQTWVQDRVSKREYLESNAHMYALIRDAKELGSRAQSQASNLQDKYNKLDANFITKEVFEAFQEKTDGKLRELQRQISNDYDSEEDSCHDSHISHVHGEVGEDSSKGEDAKSRASLQHLRSEPELMAGKEADVKSAHSGAGAGKGKISKPKDLTLGLGDAPVIEVVTTVVDAQGDTQEIRGVSVAQDEEVKSLKKSARIDLDGKSQKSFARSIRSRKLGPQQAALLESLSDRVQSLESRLDEVQQQVADWTERYGPGWSLLGFNVPEFTEMLNGHRKEGGYVGMKAWRENPLGSAAKAFSDAQE